jgi:hypothetical protein
MLAELAELDLGAARHVHAQLLATTEADDVASLSRAYQRASRCLRQTLALKARLAREAAEVRARAVPPATPFAPHDPSALQRDLLLDERITGLQRAVNGVIHAAHPDDEALREDLYERLDSELDDWIETDDFLTEDLDRQARRACRLLDLPEDLAARWRDLPRPPRPDPWAGLDEIEDELGVPGGPAAARRLDTG